MDWALHHEVINPKSKKLIIQNYFDFWRLKYNILKKTLKKKNAFNSIDGSTKDYNQYYIIKYTDYVPIKHFLANNHFQTGFLLVILQ